MAGYLKVNCIIRIMELPILTVLSKDLPILTVLSKELPILTFLSKELPILTVLSKELPIQAADTKPQSVHNTYFFDGLIWVEDLFSDCR